MLLNDGVPAARKKAFAATSVYPSTAYSLGQTVKGTATKTDVAFKFTVAPTAPAVAEAIHFSLSTSSKTESYLIISPYDKNAIMFDEPGELAICNGWDKNDLILKAGTYYATAVFSGSDWYLEDAADGDDAPPAYKGAYSFSSKVEEQVYAAPKDLKISQTATKVSLSWQPVAGASHYAVELAVPFTEGDDEVPSLSASGSDQLNTTSFSFDPTQGAVEKYLTNPKVQASSGSLGLRVYAISGKLHIPDYEDMTVDIMDDWRDLLSASSYYDCSCVAAPKTLKVPWAKDFSYHKSAAYNGKAHNAKVKVKKSGVGVLSQVIYNPKGSQGDTTKTPKKIGSYTVYASVKVGAMGANGYYLPNQRIKLGSFQIRPRAPKSISKLSSGYRSLTVKWHRQKSATNTSGYKIAYRAKGSKKWRYRYVSGRKAGKLRLRGLGAGHSYYVKVAVYKKVTKDVKDYKVCSTWTKAKLSHRLA
ncbi:MAG: fibronectin type III domain-containing protein [Coriobacteriales bacterium]|jgi:hypothetical protein|nr:fibronectin type III domain-containing protein [Coriobacteriales bacterium]